MLPAGQRRNALQDSLERRLLPLFAGRVLPLDMAGTQAYAALRARTRAAGLAISTADGCIAAIALVACLAAQAALARVQAVVV